MSYAETVAELRAAGLGRREAEGVAVSERIPRPPADDEEGDDRGVPRTASRRRKA